MKIRLNKFLADAGIASRRKCDELIFQGRVSVNKQIAEGPFVLVQGDEVIEVDGRRVPKLKRRVYYMLNKPAGYVCSSEQVLPGTKLVIDLFKHLPYRVFTVGRLDKDTTGLILVTNDGDFANRMIHPSYGITKEYLLKVRQDVSAEQLVKLSQGVYIDGRICRPVSVKKVRRGTLKITVREGKKHEVRIMAAEAGLDLLELSRIRIGSLVLGGLQYGQYRELTDAEIASYRA